jgi:hypothetical protein
MGSDEEASSHERMQRYEQLAEQEREYRTEKRAMLDDVSEELTGVVERAIATEGANVAVDSTSSDGRTQRVKATLDRAALVAAVSEELPAGFAVKGINDDGTLSIEWSRRETSAEQRAMVILQAIVTEEIVTDADELIVEAPTREQVIARATELGVEEGLAGERLQRLDDIGKVDIEEGQVFPG